MNQGQNLAQSRIPQNLALIVAKKEISLLSLHCSLCGQNQTDLEKGVECTLCGGGGGTHQLQCTHVAVVSMLQTGKFDEIIASLRYAHVPGRRGRFFVT